MPLSYIQTLGDGTTDTLTVPFPYISRAHIGVTVNGDPVPFAWLNPQLVKVSSAPALNAVVEVRRSTPRDNVLVDFVDGSTLTEGDLDIATLQSFYLSQEAFDAAGGTLGVNSDGTYSAFNRRISSLGDPVNGGDAVNKRTMDAAFNSLKAQTTEDRAATADDRRVVEQNTTDARAYAYGARQWATAPQGTIVADGQYSAYHWAMHAKAIANLSADAIPFVSPNLAGDNVGAALRAVGEQLSVRYTKDEADSKFVKAGFGVGLNERVSSFHFDMVSHDWNGDYCRLLFWGDRVRIRDSDNKERFAFGLDGNIWSPLWAGGGLYDHINHRGAAYRDEAKNWAYNNFIFDVRLNGWWETQFGKGWVHCPNGGVCTAIHSNDIGLPGRPLITSHFGGRYFQYRRGDSWNTIGVW